MTTVSEFVEIRTSVADILGIANRLRSQGTDLAETMGTTAEEITALENHPETLPPDDFTDQFTAKYHAPVDGADGVSLPANEAVKQGTIEMGKALSELGASVVTAMWAYSGQDDENATDVSNARNA